MKVIKLLKTEGIFAGTKTFSFLEKNWEEVSIGIHVFLLFSWCLGTMFLAFYSLMEVLPFYLTTLPVAVSFVFYQLLNKKPNIARKLDQPFLSTDEYNEVTGKLVIDAAFSFLLISLGVLATSLFLRLLIENDILLKSI
jgi:hypothetical protein